MSLCETLSSRRVEEHFTRKWIASEPGIPLVWPLLFASAVRIGKAAPQQVEAACAVHHCIALNTEVPLAASVNGTSLTETPKAFDPMLLVCSDLTSDRTCMTKP